MTSLYQISSDYRSILSQIEEADGEITDEQLEALHSIEGDIEDKAVMIASFIKNLEAEEASVLGALLDMKKRASGLASKIERMKNSLKVSMQMSGIDVISKSPHFKISIKYNPPKLQYLSDDIPEEFIKTTTIRTPDGVLIKERLSNGEEFPFAVLQRDTRVEIK